MTISMIVAMSENRVIGADGDLPWHLPADLKYFKATTLGKPIIMGRKTFDSIGRPLPGRKNIVITRNGDWRHDGVEVAATIEGAIALASAVGETDDADHTDEAGEAGEIMITGGAQVYTQAMGLVDRMYITEVAAVVKGDTYFPEFNTDDWAEVSRESHAATENQPAYAFVVYERRV